MPSASAIRPGTAVNIILKGDQRSGKLTRGRVADTLTRGDHPRGVKVRLEDGQVGRVQSLLEQAGPGQSVSPNTTSSTSTSTQQAQYPDRKIVSDARMQHDYRNDPVPAEERSLEDYVTFKPAKQKRGRGKAKDETVASGKEGSVKQDVQSVDLDPQEQLQKEFPLLDSALVAAIWSDVQNIEKCREVLGAISANP